ncbi:uncharacterized protein LOC120711922 [Panicum virgatum]|uniref:uncharacterized protein LOC120711922 n=1 Tax=Panicum virgatum TaxID=38727 RepID=UPI0019D66C4C|nr:uncharacterized protein LOC120711922 [Panicum virgatum]
MLTASRATASNSWPSAPSHFSLIYSKLMVVWLPKSISRQVANSVPSKFPSLLLTVSRVQFQSEKMGDQQSELEDLKLKFQESEVARENQRGEIETLKKQGERFFLL